jgi:secondary thiamine-phosphate synthase enzyme
MKQVRHELTAMTDGKGLYDLSGQVGRWLHGQDIADGLLTVFVRHTSASLVIQENADPDVLADLNDFFARLVADDRALYRHIAEGSDDMPAHIRSALTQTSLSIPVVGGALALGTWQGIYLFEHRTRPHHRKVLLHLFGD